MTTIPVGPDGTDSRLRSKIRTRDAFWVAMHANQLTVPLPTVRDLVDEQFPAWRELPIREVVSHGTVNALFRIGGGVASIGGAGSPRAARPHAVSDARTRRAGRTGGGLPASLVGADMAAGD